MVSPHSRRVFLTYGAQTMGALPTLLSTSWLLAAEGPEFTCELSLKHLRPQHQSILALLIPIALGVELHPAQPADQKLLEKALAGLDQVIDHLSARQREDIMLLLTLLSLPLTRALIARWTRWEPGNWERRVSSLKRFGYESLVQLMEAVFYALHEGNDRVISKPLRFH